jgi:hypothetical protein
VWFISSQYSSRNRVGESVSTHLPTFCVCLIFWQAWALGQKIFMCVHIPSVSCCYTLRSTVCLCQYQYCLLWHSCLHISALLLAQIGTANDEQPLPSPAPVGRHSLSFFSLLLQFLVSVWADPYSTDAESTSGKLNETTKREAVIKFISYCQLNLLCWEPYCIQYNQLVCTI